MVIGMLMAVFGCAFCPFVFLPSCFSFPATIISSLGASGSVSVAFPATLFFDIIIFAASFVVWGTTGVVWLIDKKNTLILINELQRKTMFNLKSFKMNESLTASIVILVKQSVNLP